MLVARLGSSISKASSSLATMVVSLASLHIKAVSLYFRQDLINNMFTSRRIKGRMCHHLFNINNIQTNVIVLVHHHHHNHIKISQHHLFSTNKHQIIALV
jgi:hypothetical protein